MVSPPRLVTARATAASSMSTAMTRKPLLRSMMATPPPIAPAAPVTRASRSDMDAGHPDGVEASGPQLGPAHQPGHPMQVLLVRADLDIVGVARTIDELHPATQVRVVGADELPECAGPRRVVPQVGQMLADQVRDAVEKRVCAGVHLQVAHAEQARPGGKRVQVHLRSTLRPGQV